MISDGHNFNDFPENKLNQMSCGLNSIKANQDHAYQLSFIVISGCMQFKLLI